MYNPLLSKIPREAATTAILPREPADILPRINRQNGNRLALAPATVQLQPSGTVCLPRHAGRLRPMARGWCINAAPRARAHGRERGRNDEEKVPSRRPGALC